MFKYLQKKGRLYIPETTYRWSCELPRLVHLCHLRIGHIGVLSSSRSVTQNSLFLENVWTYDEISLHFHGQIGYVSVETPYEH